MTTLETRFNTGISPRIGSRQPQHSSDSFHSTSTHPPPFPPLSSPSDPESKVLTHLLKSKQSLSSIPLCARANELVSNSRSALQKSYALNARITFITDGYRDQLQFAVETNAHLKGVESGYRDKFRRQIAELDEAERGLSSVLEELRGVTVDRVFSGEGGEGGRCLSDFVDDGGIEGLKNGLRGVIDEVEVSHNKFMATIKAFDADVARLKGVLAVFPTGPVVHSKSRLIPHVEQLEEHAEAIAGLLESLTRHYDQCCLAMKDLELPVVDPVAASERAEMLAVLENDSGQVEDVVEEIKERLASMEGVVSAEITPHMDELKNFNEGLRQAFAEFDVLQNNLSVYLVDLGDFEYSQQEYALQMEEKLAEMEGLRDFYETFRKAYNAMLGEAGRRNRMQEKRKAVLQEALKKLQVIDEEDMKEREKFRLEQGQYLPTDIWPALLDTPPKYTFTEVEAGHGNEFGEASVDNMKKTVLASNNGSNPNLYFG